MKKLLLIFIFLSGFHLQAGTDDHARLNALCVDPSSPFKYDRGLQSYSVEFDKMENGKKVTWSYPLRFDPFSGTPLPTGTDAFFEVDPVFFKKVTGELAGAKTLESVKKILGKPDEEFGSDPVMQGELVYTSLSPSTMIIIQKPVQGDVLGIYAAGKQKHK